MANPSAGPVITGATFPGVPGFPPADVTDLGKQLAALLPPITWAYRPDTPTMLKQADPVILYDGKFFRGEFRANLTANNPTFGTSAINARSVSIHTNASGKGLVSNQGSTVGSFCAIGYFEVSTAFLALSSTRPIFNIGTGASYLSFVVAGSSSNMFVSVPTSTTIIQANFGAVTAGNYVFVIDYDIVGKTVALYLNNSTTPLNTVSLSGSTLAQINQPLAIGCLAPGSGGWEGKIGRILFCANQRLGGSTAANAARAAAMAAMGNNHGVAITV
jgi:hypothetical protein